MKIIDFYQKIKDKESLTAEEKFISDCFRYNVFFLKPSKTQKKNFESVFGFPYPEDTKDLSPKIKSEMKKVINYKKEKEKFEEKRKKQRAEKGFSDSDCWDICSWFLDIMPQMLQQMRDNLSGFPTSSVPFPNNSQAVETDKEPSVGMKKWQDTLDKMIFLLREMNEDTCSYKNNFEEEYQKLEEDFRNKYGFCGEKLKSEEELEEERKTGASRMYFPSDFPELYPEAEKITHAWASEMQRISIYRNECREEFFNLFSRNFWDLWD